MSEERRSFFKDLKRLKGIEKKKYCSIYIQCFIMIGRFNNFYTLLKLKMYVKFADSVKTE